MSEALQFPAGRLPVVLDTSDVQEAQTAECRHALSVVPGEVEFRAIRRALWSGSVGIHLLEYGAQAVLDLEPLARWVMVGTPVKGHITVESGQTSRMMGVGESIVLDPYRQARVTLQARSRLLILQFEREAVERELGDLLGSDQPVPARFSLHELPSGKALQTWRWVSSVAAHMLLAEDTQEAYPLTRRQLERSLIAALIETHLPLRLPDPDHVDCQELPVAVRRAMALMYADPARSFEVGELARAASLSPRALQEAFRRHLDTTPLGFARQVRLERAHADLLAGESPGTTVAEVAHRWGFGNLGRFAAEYAKRFGSMPSDTLRRTG